MSSQEMKKKEKGKEVVTFEENLGTSFHHLDHFDHMEEVSMVLSEQEISALLESAGKETCKENLESKQSKKDGIEEGKSSSSSKITPCIFYTSDEKARLRWSRDLHDCFVNAVAKLGGPDKATPKSVKEKMEVEGISLHHVKSHLQKFRLGKCNIRDETNQYIRRFKNAREITKKRASLDSPNPQVNILSRKPKVMGSVKPKPKKAKEVQGSLYKLIEHDLQLQRSRETQRMQMDLAIENQRNMLEAPYLKASITPYAYSQHTNYISSISQQPLSQKQEQWSANPSTMNESQQTTSIIIPQTTTSIEELCNENMACLSLCDYTQNIRSTLSMNEPQIYPTQRNAQLNDNHSYNMAQGFINPYMNIKGQSMSGLSTVVPGVTDTLHQGTSNNTIHFSATPQSVQANVPYHTYVSYPAYNTLEVVKAQLNALQNSSTSQNQEIPSLETNLSSLPTRDEVDHVDEYIDWGKVEEMNIELDPVEILEALGFGVNP